MFGASSGPGWKLEHDMPRGRKSARSITAAKGSPATFSTTRTDDGDCPRSNISVRVPGSKTRLVLARLRTTCLEKCGAGSK